MSEGAEGLMVLAAIALGSATIWHWVVPLYKPAVIGAAITTSVAFQVAAYAHLGYLDSFVLVATITSAIAGAVVAMLVGLPFRARRKANAGGVKAL